MGLAGRSRPEEGAAATREEHPVDECPYGVVVVVQLFSEERHLGPGDGQEGDDEADHRTLEDVGALPGHAVVGFAILQHAKVCTAR